MLRSSGPLKILTLSLLLVAGLVSLPASAQAACTATRQQVLADLNSGLTAEDIQVKYAGCVADDTTPVTGSTGTTTASPKALPFEDSEKVAAFPNPQTPTTQIITNTGSTFYEAIKTCGYHPQRKELACTIEIRQRFGFGGNVCAAAGSHEFVTFCVDYGAGLVLVNINGFHIHDEGFGVNPNWYFAAVVQSDWRLLSQPYRGQTLKARAILSWGAPVLNCVNAPTWGNQADFRIRLDP
jgi:hypothetical protein